MKLEDLIRLVASLNDEATNQTYHCGANLQPFKFVFQDADRVAITFLDQPLWEKGKEIDLDDPEGAANFKQDLYNWLDALRALDLDRLSACLPQPKPVPS